MKFTNLQSERNYEQTVTQSEAKFWGPGPRKGAGRDHLRRRYYENYRKAAA